MDEVGYRSRNSPDVFITDLAGSADDASIVQAVISMAHSLRLKVIAEGVLEGKALQPSQVFEPDPEPAATPDVELEEVVAPSEEKPAEATSQTTVAKTEPTLTQRHLALRRQGPKR